MTVPEPPPAAPGSERYRAVIADRKATLERQLAAIFSSPASFVWELGCGHGHFLTAYAAAHPTKICVGVDIVGERIERAVRKRHRAGLPNLHFLHAEAGLFLDALPPGAAFSDVFVLFPDPWPKLRHRKHRIMRPDFLDRVAGRGAPDCRLFFRTDYEPYFASAREVVAAHPRWRPTEEEPWPFEFQTVFQSRASRFYSLIARWRP